MTKIFREGNLLILSYTREYEGENWIRTQYESNGVVRIKKVLTFRVDDIHKQEENKDRFEYQFIIGDKEGEYFKLRKKVFSINKDIYFHVESRLKIKHFITVTNASVINRIDKLIKESIYIGGRESGNGKVSLEDYEKILNFMPNAYEVKLYLNSRIESILSNFILTTDEAERKFNKFLDKKLKGWENADFTKQFKEYEIKKLQTTQEFLSEMLENETKYSEDQWQDQILKILILLFPKYIAVFKEVNFKDIYSEKTRRLDYVLVDYLGHIDIIEIKKPMDGGMVSKNHYRDNHIPKRELSGTIMQIEKYIYYLNKWGKTGEDQLTKNYSSQLPKGMKIKITNPNGIIIMGREKGLSLPQLNDLEVIKRKYKNVIDIITYDDLIKRIKISIEQMKKI